MSRTALVTGSHGLLGSWLTKALLEAGNEVVALDQDCDRLSPLCTMGLGPEVMQVEGDVCDRELLRATLGNHSVDDVFHLAAQTIVGTAQEHPAETFDSNIRGTWELLETCREALVERVVVASSDKAYGSSPELPYTEHTPLRPTAPYEVSKAATDMIARCYATEFGLPVAVTRCANIYGGGDPNHSRLVPEAIAAVLEGRAPVIRSDGSPQRDFLYVEDAAAAYLALAGVLDQPGMQGRAFNIGTGQPHSVAEVVALICELSGSEIEPDIQGSGTPAGEIDCQYVDASAFTTATGWSPLWTLRDGLDKTLEWERSRIVVESH